MRNIYETLLNQAISMRQIDGAGYLDVHERLDAGGVSGPFLINCNRLAYAAVKSSNSLEEAKMKVLSDVDAIIANARKQGISEDDLQAGAYVKEALPPYIEKHWNRTPIMRVILGVLDSYPQLVGIPIMAVFLSLIVLAWQMGWMK